MKHSDVLIPRFNDHLLGEGHFAAYEFSIATGEERLVFEDHNQIQYEGASAFARLFCTGFFAFKKPFFRNIKASAALNPGTDSQNNQVANVAIAQTDNFLPGDQTRDDLVVSCDRFLSRISIKDTNRYIECQGTFLSPPPSLGGPLATEGTFYHFGLYLSQDFDVDQYFLAYKFIQDGISYSEGSGLKIAWKIKLNN